MSKLTKIVVDLSKPENEQQSVVELTDAEIAEHEARVASLEAERLTQEKAAAEKEAQKQSAKDKLAALGLTDAEITALLGA